MGFASVSQSSLARAGQLSPPNRTGPDRTHQLLQRRELLVRLREERLLVFSPAQGEEGALLVACSERGAGGLALAFEDNLYLWADPSPGVSARGVPVSDERDR